MCVLFIYLGQSRVAFFQQRIVNHHIQKIFLTENRLLIYTKIKMYGNTYLYGEKNKILFFIVSHGLSFETRILL